jgi:hypothetical protein
MYTGDLRRRNQAEAEDGLTAGNDASNGLVANLLQNDSAGSADSASAALGGVAELGWLVRLSTRLVETLCTGV